MAGPDSFDWNDLRHFLAVVRTGSTLAASKQLGVNQTTCARRIQALEEALGQRLFDRTQGGRGLTEFGQSLVAPAEAVEAQVRVFADTVASHGRRLAGVVRVTATEAMANLVLAPALMEFRRQYPDIRVELIVTDDMLDILAGEADIALRSVEGGGPKELGLVVRKVMDVQFALYCGPAYAERHGEPAIGTLERHVLIGGAGDMARAPWVRWIMATAPSAEVQNYSSSLTNMVHSARAGLGVCALPIIMAEDAGGLICCSAPIEALNAPIYLTAPERLRDQPRVRAFMDFIAPYLLTFSRARLKPVARAGA